MDESRYRLAERALWQDAGVTPTERRIHLSRNDVDVRVVEVGDGPPVLFLHGGPGAAAGSWAHLAARLPNLRCLLLDRPGTGLSDANPLADIAAVRRECSTLVADVLDALGIERAHVVGSSHGSYAALLSAAQYPDRIDRSVHLGCPGFIEGMTVSAFDRLVLLPGAHRVFSSIPVGDRSLRSTMRQLGHDVDEEEFPQSFLSWSIALARHTDTMVNELANMSRMGTFRRGFSPDLTVGVDTLAAVSSPSYFLWGDQDPYGGEDTARRLVDAMPAAELEILPGGGHLCWLDDLDHAARTVHDHLFADRPSDSDIQSSSSP
jgi:2-hydroxy-6-oxonona-2,4-dienedioate hydrolase